MAQNDNGVCGIKNDALGHFKCPHFWLTVKGVRKIIFQLIKIYTNTQGIDINAVAEMFVAHFDSLRAY